MKRVTVYFEEDLHKALKFKAAETSRPVSDLVNRAVREALQRDPAPEMRPARGKSAESEPAPERRKESAFDFESVFDQMKRDGHIFD